MSNSLTRPQSSFLAQLDTASRRDDVLLNDEDGGMADLRTLSQSVQIGDLVSLL